MGATSAGTNTSTHHGAKPAATQYAISELPFASVSKRVNVRNQSIENVFQTQVHF